MMSKIDYNSFSANLLYLLYFNFFSENLVLVVIVLLALYRVPQIATLARISIIRPYACLNVRSTNTTIQIETVSLVTSVA